MKKEFWAVLAAGIWLAVAGTNLLAGDLLYDPGFEFDNSGASQNFIGWTAYGINTYSETGSDAHSGENYIIVSSASSGSVNFNGVYQDHISGPGATYSADGWAKTISPNVIAGQNVAWLEVSFRDANASVLALYRSRLINTNAVLNGTFPTNIWVDLLITNQYDPNTFVLTNTVSSLVAPPGTSFVRIQVVFQGDAANSGGTVYFDDLDLNLTSTNPYGNWQIVWDDEFNGTTINTNVWTFDIGGGGWGNGELEYYTSRTNNAYVAGGMLHIIAQQESYGGESFTSARLKTQGLVAWTYGRFEWRAQLPAGYGLWPALWLMGVSYTNPSVGWPACGEIDALENIGAMPDFVQGTLHSGSDEYAVFYFPFNESTTNFHNYVLDWNTNNFRWYVDGFLYETQTNWQNELNQSFPAPFNQPFFMIMDVAVGGNYNGNPTAAEVSSNGIFPGEMLVDYVRVYNLTAPLTMSVMYTNNSLLISWPANVAAHLQAQYDSDNAGINPTNWTDLNQTNNPALINISNGCAFFRLESP